MAAAAEVTKQQGASDEQIGLERLAAGYQQPPRALGTLKMKSTVPQARGRSAGERR